MNQSKVPRHIGIILDGNRRFSKRLMAKPWKGHEWGAEKVKRLFEWCKELGIKEITLYALSIENFNRPKKEFKFLMSLFRREFKNLLTDPRVHKNKVQINFIGRIYLLPDYIQALIKQVTEATKQYKNYRINFAMAYGGRAEVIDATRKIAEQIKSGTLNVDEINEKVLTKNLYLASEPDLIIRTSGEQRTSGFLPWQGAYAELHFCNKLWPEFEKEDLIQAVNAYTVRERRFGK